MGNAEEYRAYAAQAMKLAANETTPSDKSLMLRIAQGWLELATRAEAAIGTRRQPGEPRRDHPPQE
jgi:hypothetical protein